MFSYGRLVSVLVVLILVSGCCCNKTKSTKTIESRGPAPQNVAIAVPPFDSGGLDKAAVRNLRHTLPLSEVRAACKRVYPPTPDPNNPRWQIMGHSPGAVTQNGAIVGVY